MSTILNEHQRDFYKRIQYMDGTAIYELNNANGTKREYKKENYDWYMVVAIEKCNKVAKDRHLLTAELICSYRNAIREGYNHMLDPYIRNPYDHPRNRNTISGIEKYIENIYAEQERIRKENS